MVYRAQLGQLSAQLADKFRKGFDITNLRNIRRFYMAFTIRNAVRLELSQIHY
ncbi:TPA: hypothetical protein O4F91_001204 [Vibrio alginolyticus]|nr:hypothetical protein [Vibrio alginolyticus]HCZ9054071.1 hypothetical protein [Vibrio alginolyticus]